MLRGLSRERRGKLALGLVSERLARPFVVIDFNAWRTIIEVTITNAGATLARDVRFEFDPPFVSTHDGSPRREGGISGLSIFKNGIPSLAPGKEIRLRGQVRRPLRAG